MHSWATHSHPHSQVQPTAGCAKHNHLHRGMTASCPSNKARGDIHLHEQKQICQHRPLLHLQPTPEIYHYMMCASPNSNSSHNRTRSKTTGIVPQNAKQHSAGSTGGLSKQKTKGQFQLAACAIGASSRPPSTKQRPSNVQRSVDLSHTHSGQYFTSTEPCFKEASELPRLHRLWTGARYWPRAGSIPRALAQLFVHEILDTAQEHRPLALRQTREHVVGLVRVHR